MESIHNKAIKTLEVKLITISIETAVWYKTQFNQNQMLVENI